MPLPPFRGFVAVTDFDWFSKLKAQSGVDEVNFWQPNPSGVAAPVGTPWLFKLRSPYDAIVGGGFFTHYTRMPVGSAWDAFGTKNGANSMMELVNLLARYGKTRTAEVGDIGCVILSEPFFLEPQNWIGVPDDWKPNIVKGKYYDLSAGIGARLWSAVTERIATRPFATLSPLLPGGKGKPTWYTPRLGQGGFRAIVSDAYARRCAITGERTFPVLEAAHIKPFSIVGTHDVRNGLLLRSDLHKLFDQGYVTVGSDLRFKVSKSIREEFENGRDYYALHGREIRLPSDPAFRPDATYLEWHGDERFKS
ncbi:MAG TPA: HNH endonuclease [Candidatus Baltobacteraceae bacterium]|jgi:putative restriction endonuclease